MFSHAIPVERGCGTRTEGGIYAEVGMGAEGFPLECFLCDPPVRIEEGIPVSTQGVTTVVKNGITHILDRIGSQHYPTVTSFLEEVRRFGVSRKIPRNFDFSQLQEGSCILLIHERGYISNWPDMVKVTGWTCPKRLAHHTPERIEEMCAGLWWEDTPDEVEHDAIDFEEYARLVDRDIERALYRERSHGGVIHPLSAGEGRLTCVKMPSFTYFANLRPEGFTPQYEEAIIAHFPISGLSVVRAEGDMHLGALEKALKARLPVEEVDY